MRGKNEQNNNNMAWSLLFLFKSTFLFLLLPLFFSPSALDSLGFEYQLVSEVFLKVKPEPFKQK